MRYVAFKACNGRVLVQTTLKSVRHSCPAAAIHAEALSATATDVVHVLVEQTLIYACKSTNASRPSALSPHAIIMWPTFVLFTLLSRAHSDEDTAKNEQSVHIGPYNSAGPPSLRCMNVRFQSNPWPPGPLGKEQLVVARCHWSSPFAMPSASSTSCRCSLACTSPKPVAVEAEGARPAYLRGPSDGRPSDRMHEWKRGCTCR